MWSSTLPTGTVREENRGSRTFPEQSTPQSPRREQSPHREGRPHHRPGQRDNAADPREAELQALRDDHRQAQAEIQRLESEVDRLQEQVATHRQDKQSVVDRYERIIAELESAAATAPASAASDRRATPSSIVDRLESWLL